MADSSAHRYALLGPFLHPDVVGPQDDIYSAAKEWWLRGRYELHELKSASSAGQVRGQSSKTAAEESEGTGRLWAEISLPSVSPKP